MIPFIVKAKRVKIGDMAELNKFFDALKFHLYAFSKQVRRMLMEKVVTMPYRKIPRIVIQAYT